ncbi:hypothetical protein MHH49_05705 [Paenibacillus sp. FSL F4-0122]|uniref:hypothetical protein n=1 Tax=Paenibacillus sp. FSL F4-0122 TaxID=2921371 RepID=UPI0030F66A43
MSEKAATSIKRYLLTVDHLLMQIIGHYGHISVTGISNLLLEPRPKNTIYQRTRVLSEWGYIEPVVDRHKRKIFRLTQRGVDELMMQGVTIRGRSFLQSDLARVAWAIEQNGFIETLGLEVQSSTKPLDAVSKGETPRALIVDNPNVHIANTFQRIEEVVKVATINAPLDIIALSENRAAELQRYVNTNGCHFTVLLQTIDI